MYLFLNYSSNRLTITGNYLITHKAQIAKQLVIMRLAIGQSLLLVVAVSQKRLLALGANKMLQCLNIIKITVRVVTFYSI